MIPSMVAGFILIACICLAIPFSSVGRDTRDGLAAIIGVTFIVCAIFTGCCMYHASNQIVVDKTNYYEIQTVDVNGHKFQMAMIEDTLINVSKDFSNGGMYDTNASVLRVETYRQECGGWCFISWHNDPEYKIVARPETRSEQ